VRAPAFPQIELLARQVRANPRLQAGLGLIAVLLVGWIFLVLGDLRAAKLRQLQDARHRLAQVQQLAGQDVWLQRADQAERLARMLAAELPPTRSPGLAQAAFQGWLKQIVDPQDSSVRMDVQAPDTLDAPPDTVRVTAMISGTGDPQRAWQLIRRIESSSALVTIPVLSVRSDGTNHGYSLTVQGYYHVPAGTDPP
jgi:hypothetical protein